MHIILDILLITAPVCFALRGWRRGFAKAVLKSGRWILSVMAALSFGPAVSAFMDRLWIHPLVYEKIHDYFMGMAEAANGQVDVWLSRIPAAFLPYLMHTESADQAKDLYTLAEEWAQDAAFGLSGMISSVVGHVLLFLLAYAILTLVVLLARNLTKVPVVGTLDHLLGLAFGLVAGILTVVLLSMLVTALLRISGNGLITEQSILLRRIGTFIGTK